MAKIPVLSEAVLEAQRDILIREFRQNPMGTVETRLNEVDMENPRLAEWLQDSALHLEKAAIFIPESYELPEGVPQDQDRKYISLRLAQNTLLVTVFQIYKALKAQMEVDEMEAGQPQDPDRG